MDGVNLIAFCGRKGAGKTTIAKLYAYKQQIPPYIRLSFAKPIKDMLAGLGLTHSQLYSPVEKERKDPRFGKSPRQLAQTLGTEWGRELIHPDIWVNALKSEIEGTRKTYNGKVGTLIDDLRFVNEAEMVKSMGGIIVHLTGSHTSSEADHHVSEQFDDKLMSLVDIRIDGERPPQDVVEELIEKLKKF